MSKNKSNNYQSKKALQSSKKSLQHAKGGELKKPDKKSRITIFQIKLVLALIILILSYRYPIPIDGLRNQGMLTLVILSIFLVTKPSPYVKLTKKFSYPKLMFVLIYVAIIFPLMLFADVKYNDWDNAQMIKGLHRDFPILISEIEQATGLDLEQKTDCSITTEKFSSGVRTCELSSGSLNVRDIQAVQKSVTTTTAFSNYTDYENNEGINISYRNQNSCNLFFAAQDRFNLSCVTAVREANIELARELFLK